MLLIFVEYLQSILFCVNDTLLRSKEWPIHLPSFKRQQTFFGYFDSTSASGGIRALNLVIMIQVCCHNATGAQPKPCTLRIKLIFS